MAGTQAPEQEPILVNHPRYEEVHYLGNGAHGSVRLAREREPGPEGYRYVAIKFIRRGAQTITQHVWREIVNHRPLDHPHVIQIEQVILTDTHLGIVLEYVAGGNLFNFVKSQPGQRLSETQARWFFQQIVTAIDYCHRMGICNRDIKLENTLLDGSHRGPIIKLCDFGLSKHEGAQGRPVTFVGTPDYMAPEVISALKGATYDGKAADVWSAGVMLYAMLTGCSPFHPRAAELRGNPGVGPHYLLCTRILNVDYDMPANVSPECQQVLQRIFVRDPAQRITIAGIYDQPWFNQNLPTGVKEMNDRYGPKKRLQQSEDEVLALFTAAQQAPAAWSQDVPDANEAAIEDSIINGIHFSRSSGWHDTSSSSTTL